MHQPPEGNLVKYTRAVQLRLRVTRLLQGQSARLRPYQQYLKATIKLGKVLFILPYSWDSEKQQPVPSSSGFGLKLWKIRAGVLAMHFMYTLVRLVKAMLESGSSSAGGKFHVLMTTFFYFLGPLCELVNVTFRHQWHGHVVKQMKLFKIAEENLPRSEVENLATIGELIEMIALATLPSNVAVVAAHALLFNRHPGSVFPLVEFIVEKVETFFGDQESSFQSLIVCYGVSGLLQLYIVSNIAILGILFLQTIMNSSTTAFLMLRSFRSGNPNFIGIRFKTAQLSKIQYFNATRLLIDECANFYQIVGGCIHLLVSILVVISAYCVIRVGGLVGLVAGLIGMSFLIMILAVIDYAANLNCHSGKQIGEWLNTSFQFGSLERKSMRPLRKLRFHVSNMYTFSKMTVVITLGVIIDNTVNILLVK